MQIVYGLENLTRPETPVALAIGNFDGVHRGHQSILRRVVELANTHRLTPVVMTFEFHPLKVLAPQSAPALLMPLARRQQIMAQLGIKLVVVARCVHSFLQMDRGQFVRDVLMKCFDVKYIVEGPNFRFGCDRTGDIDYLIRVGHEFGFQAIKMEPVRVNLDDLGTQTVSSSLIRRLIAAGRVDLARMCLGRPYELLGPIVVGTRRGRTIGFPTANLDPGEQLRPQEGVYVTEATVDDRTYPAATVVGPAPTFGQMRPVVEAHFLGYDDGDLYGRDLRLGFYRRIRDIHKFTGAAELVPQIQRDVAAVREFFNREEKSLPCR